VRDRRVGQDHTDVDRQRLQPQGIQVVLFQLLVWLAGVWFVSDVEAGQDEPTVTGGYHYYPARQQVCQWLDAAGFAVSGQAEAGCYWHLLLTRS
jgi:hypothetical protein